MLLEKIFSVGADNILVGVALPFNNDGYEYVCCCNNEGFAVGRGVV